MRSLVLALACLLVAEQVRAASVTVTRKSRYPSAAAVASDPALHGKVIVDWFLTSSGDIRSINQVEITINGTTNGSQLYQNAAGSDVEPPNPLFIAALPALAADSWITTPGGTSSAGGGFSTPGSSWFDSDNNGPPTNFHFARLTSSYPNFPYFRFRVSILNDAGDGVENFSFDQTLEDNPYGTIAPEPSALALAGAGLFALASAWRRR